MNEKLKPGARLRLCLMENHIKQYELAEKIGYTVETINRVINGKTKMTERFASLCADVLGVYPDYLLGKIDFKDTNELKEYAESEKRDQEALAEIFEFFAMRYLQTSYGIAIIDECVENENGQYSTDSIEFGGLFVRGLGFLPQKRLTLKGEPVNNTDPVYYIISNGDIEKPVKRSDLLEVFDNINAYSEFIFDRFKKKYFTDN